MAKLQIKSETMATFGGIFHVMNVFERLGLGTVIDSRLTTRDASWKSLLNESHAYGTRISSV